MKVLKEQILKQLSLRKSKLYLIFFIVSCSSIETNSEKVLANLKSRQTLVDWGNYTKEICKANCNKKINKEWLEQYILLGYSKREQAIQHLNNSLEESIMINEIDIFESYNMNNDSYIIVFKLDKKLLYRIMYDGFKDKWTISNKNERIPQNICEEISKDKNCCPEVKNNEMLLVDIYTEINFKNGGVKFKNGGLCFYTTG